MFYFPRRWFSFPVFCLGIFMFSVWSMLTLWWCNCDSQELDLLEAMEKKERNGQWNFFGKTKIFLTLLIFTSPLESEKRKLVRETWLKAEKLAKRTVSHRFPVGTNSLSREVRESLHLEQEAYGDLLFLEDHKDVYSNLTGKLLASLTSVAELENFEFLLKVDDDSFVRLPELVNSLEQAAHPRLYWGFFNGRAHVKGRGKWKEEEWVLCDRYLPYALGGGYVIARDLVNFLVQNRKFLKWYSSEDVSVGTWLAGLDLRYLHDPRFDTEFKSRGCSNQYLITHKQTQGEIRKKWERLRETGKLCEKEFRVRYSYIYNWNVPPTQCCNRTKDLGVP